MNQFAKYIHSNKDLILPGFEAQVKMAPKIKGLTYRNFQAKQDAKMSAVLLLIIGETENFDILFTLRSGKLRSHNSQISFPGGRKDGQETPIQTAIRETYEEVGISENEITVVGELTELYVPPSNSVIKPIIGYTDSLPVLKINEDEVEEAFLVNVDEFYNSDKFGIIKREINGQTIETPQWNIHHKTSLWGATAIIMSEFLELHKFYKSLYS